ncbi:PQQ-dependent sugar dehydrogenase [Marinomonas sp. C2222]|uniref:PQQ-dependent sugar dehydrogenase n=1 Tax=Marinomonas sargassi TaxID=2984494 RepID=A0ABT2YRZ8_9GAMM|nr:PQQ-dependent sugar dehydrogenase [Marinomonas sargassi]MCV2402664.1 PQQ-dependent sugar dehydrogenase [Marinomonas sargassi]
MKCKTSLFITALAVSAFSSNAFTSTTEISNDQLQVEKIHTFDGIPWGITLLNDDTAIVTIKSGSLYRVDLDSGQTQVISGLPKLDDSGQGGLLDIAILASNGVSPDNKQSPKNELQEWLYFTYSKPSSEGSSTSLARAKVTENTLTEWQDLYTSNAHESGNKHYGSRIAFDGKGHVFFTIGNRGERDNAQDLTHQAGSILRLNTDGSIPEDNPFVNQSNVAAAIWSYGHRNPQGIYYDQSTQTLWSNEHGPRGGDEINLIKSGANYGWPIVSHGKEYWNFSSIGEGTEKEGIEKSLKVFIPSIAPSSLLRYQGGEFTNWKGDFLSTALAKRHLNKVSINDDGSTSEQRFLEELDERLRSIAVDSNGVIYLTTDSGKLLRLTLKK